MIVTIVGPSGSGKTSMLIRQVSLAQTYGFKYVIIKPKVSVDGYHYDIRLMGRPVIPREEIIVWGEDELPDENIDFVFVEDAQFFSVEEIKALLDKFGELATKRESEAYQKRRRKGKTSAAEYHAKILFYLTPEDYMGEKFEVTDMLMSEDYVDFVLRRQVRCYMCETRQATKTQRLINEIPASLGTPRLFFDDKIVKHVPVCEQCYKHPSEVEFRLAVNGNAWTKTE